MGLFIAPSVVFFALTGIAQLFSLHEAHGDYHPAPIIEKLSSVHKDQVYALGHHGPPPGGPQSGPSPQGPDHDADDDHGPAPSTFALKIFFMLVSVALCGSTVLGVWLSLAQRSRGGLRWALLLAGMAIPVILLLL